jgi:sorbitol-6-phosphate 2-dehydrogenase
MHASLTGQVAIVTGAGQGLGEALARRLDAEGCHVAVADINAEAASAVAASLQNGLGFAVDVTDEEQVSAMVDASLQSGAVWI